MRLLVGILTAAILLASAGEVRASIYFDTDYCHPIKRHSQWWRCDGTSLARWLYDHPIAPKGVHPVPPKGR